MYKKLASTFSGIVTLLFVLLFPLNLNAQLVDLDSADTTANRPPQCVNKYDCGNYDVNDMVMIAVTAAKWILGIVGSLTLLMFIYGGFLFLVSSGSSEQITKAKNVLIAAVIGLVIVFSSYLIIKFVLSSIGIEWNGNKTPISQAYERSLIS
ncbi:hypothetical protein JXE04_00750 [Patescibacteria group bacterium]|nr:hypothetical protein [Patescibacteria group bacterium]